MGLGRGGVGWGGGELLQTMHCITHNLIICWVILMFGEVNTLWLMPLFVSSSRRVTICIMHDVYKNEDYTSYKSGSNEGG